jgi:hypothetical protein
MNRQEIIQYIRKETMISEKQKISLMHMLYKHTNNFDSLCGWIKSLNIFASEAYQELLSFEKMEVVKTLIKGSEERISDGTFGKLLEVFFGKASYFPNAVLGKLQKEKEHQVKALLAQLLLLFNNHPIEGSRLEDYLSGLHHRDELFRCKMLHFLHKHYGGEGLALILEEAIQIAPPPSLFFYMTLSHYLRLHPRINWEEEIQKIIWSKINFSRNQIAKDGIEILFEQMQHSILRHEFLSLIHTCEQRRLQISNESDREPPSGGLERFEKINSFKMEVKNVSFHNNQNRDIGSRNSEKNAVRFEI